MEQQKFKIVQSNVNSATYNLHTTFDVTSDMVKRVEEVTGVAEATKWDRYTIRLTKGVMFTQEQVVAELTAFFEDMEIVKNS